MLLSLRDCGRRSVSCCSPLILLEIYLLSSAVVKMTAFVQPVDQADMEIARRGCYQGIEATAGVK